MKADNINKVKKILQFKREIIGVKFIHYKEQYDKNETKEYGLRTTYCNMVMLLYPYSRLFPFH